MKKLLSLVLVLCLCLAIGKPAMAVSKYKITYKTTDNGEILISAKTDATHPSVWVGGLYKTFPKKQIVGPQWWLCSKRDGIQYLNLYLLTKKQYKHYRKRVKTIQNNKDYNKIQKEIKGLNQAYIQIKIECYDSKVAAFDWVVKGV